MTVTIESVNSRGGMTTIEVSSDLTPPVWFDWYTDGTFIGRTQTTTRGIPVGLDDQVRVAILDTTSEATDPIANAPDEYPARRTLWWTPPPQTDIDRYLVQQRIPAASFATIRTVPHDEATYGHSVETDRLDDLTEYEWQIIPVDTSGNEGTPTVIGPEEVTRRPDAPDFTLTFDDGTTRVTFAEAT